MDFYIIIASVSLAVLILVALLLILVTRSRRARGKVLETNYRVLFQLGVVFILTGAGTIIVFHFVFGSSAIYVGLPILTMGIIYFISGLANRDKW